MPPAFKYANHMKECDRPCPPKDARCAQRPAVRFVFADPASTKSYLPLKLLQPERGFTPEEACPCCALSMFDTEAQARRRFKGLRDHPNIGKTIGTWLAKGIVRAVDGVHHPERSGHFNLYEFSLADLSKTFTCVGPL